MSDPTVQTFPSPIQIESIVSSNRDREAKGELAVVSKVKNFLLSETTTSMRKMTELSNSLLSLHKERSKAFIEKMSTTLDYVIPDLVPQHQGSLVSPLALSLFEVMVEQSTLIEE